MTKPEKVCIECKTGLGRYWGMNFCESCFRQLLTDHLAEEDKRHENMRTCKVKQVAEDAEFERIQITLDEVVEGDSE